MRRVLLTLLVAALAAGVTGCGGAVTSTVDPVAAAATKTAGAGGFKADLTVTLTANGTPLTMAAHGWFGPHEGQLVADLSGLGAPAGTDGSLTMRYRTEDGNPVMYLQLGFLSSVLPGGKQWVRLDLAKAGKAMGIDLSRLMGGATQNPTDSLHLLRSTGDFSALGTETVDGVETTHYRGTVDLGRAAAASGLPADVIQRLRELGAPTEYPVNVWIDSAGYVRRFETKYHATLGAKAASMSMRMDLSDYGTTVVVSAPPADQVFDATDFAVKGLASFSQGSRG